jgi:nucleoid DNA-binding protein
VLCEGFLLQEISCMTQAELVERVADKLQLTKKQPEAVVNMVLH